MLNLPADQVVVAVEAAVVLAAAVTALTAAVAAAAAVTDSAVAVGTAPLPAAAMPPLVMGLATPRSMFPP